MSGKSGCVYPWEYQLLKYAPLLTLPLLVLGILTDHAKSPMPLYYLAAVTDLFHRGPNLHSYSFPNNPLTPSILCRAHSRARREALPIPLQQLCRKLNAQRLIIRPGPPQLQASTPAVPVCRQSPAFGWLRAFAVSTGFPEAHLQETGEHHPRRKRDRARAGLCSRKAGKRSGGPAFCRCGGPCIVDSLAIMGMLAAVFQSGASTPYD